MKAEKISAFEFAIMEIADPKEAKKYKPFTRDEELQMRKDKLRKQAKRMKITKENE